MKFDIFTIHTPAPQRPFPLPSPELGLVLPGEADFTKQARVALRLSFLVK